MNTSPISICMIAKNEERFLEGCFEKLLPYSFEIIFVDTGSTDSTLEIAKKYTKNIYHFTWIDDFSAARNFAASKATNDWILALDCDEYLNEFNIDELSTLLIGHEKMVGALSIENIISNGKAHSKSYQTVLRLYNKKYCHFVGLVHEQINRIDGEKMHSYDLPISAIHYGYFLTAEENQKKNLRNITLLLKEIELHPNEPYYYFQLGQSYSMLEDYEKVFFYLNKGLELGISHQAPYATRMLINYGTAMLNTGRYELALKMELLYDSLSEYSDYLFLLGQIYHANNKLLEALQAFVKATTAPKQIVHGTNSFFPLNSMAHIYEQIGETEMATSCRQQAEMLVQSLVSEIENFHDSYK